MLIICNNYNYVSLSNIRSSIRVHTSIYNVHVYHAQVNTPPLTPPPPPYKKIMITKTLLCFPHSPPPPHTHTTPPSCMAVDILVTKSVGRYFCRQTI